MSATEAQHSAGQADLRNALAVCNFMASIKMAHAGPKADLEALRAHALEVERLFDNASKVAHTGFGEVTAERCARVSDALRTAIVEIERYRALPDEPSYPAAMGASSPSEASAGNLPQDEPNYKALYTELKGEVDQWKVAAANSKSWMDAYFELKGEVLEKVGPFVRDHDKWIAHDDYKGGDLTIAQWIALSSLHEKLSSIGGSSSTETAAPLADGKLTAGEAQRESEEAFQPRVRPWMHACFGEVIPYDRTERGDRLLEEVFELLQSGGYERSRVAELCDYTWNRPPGEPRQEVGGVMVTLAAYCLAHDLDMHEAGEAELARIWTKVETIRAKQAAKPRGIALPVDPASLADAPSGVTATGVSADPGGTETKPEQNLHEKGSEG